MFEKFFRVDTPEHRKVTGTGVGMYVTKQYVEAMGGKTWFTSNPGEDTVFYFSLPITGKSIISSEPLKVTPKQTDSKWIMRWRRRMR
jgi:signal transduction histidine kinase